MKDDKKQEIYEEFYDRVNMTPSEIEDRLKTEKSQSVFGFNPLCCKQLLLQT